MLVFILYYYQKHNICGQSIARLNLSNEQGFSMHKYASRKIIITQRLWQFIAATGFVLLTTLVRYYPFNLHFGLWLGGLIFVVIFGLAYLREERRATKSADSNLVLNWNLIEAILLFLSAVGFFVVAFVFHLSDDYLYGYLHTGILGLLIGVALGEFFWQNLRLKQLDESCKNRYWDHYKDSIF